MFIISKLRSGSQSDVEVQSDVEHSFNEMLVEDLNLDSEEDPISDEFTGSSEDYWAEYDLITLEMRISRRKMPIVEQI